MYLADTKWWFSTHESNHRIVFLPRKFEDYLLYSVCEHFLGLHSHILLQRVVCFILGLELFHKKEVWIVFKILIMWIGTGAIRAWKTIFEIAKLLKTTIRPSRVRFPCRQRFNTLCTLETIFRKLHSSFILLLHEKESELFASH